jgi:hypothetical protein
MIDQKTYLREKRRLAIAANRFARLRQEVPANPYSHEADAEAMPKAMNAAVRLFDVAREGLDIFAEVGYPDAWHRWDVAERDAAAFIHRHRSDYEAISGCKIGRGI